MLAPFGIRPKGTLSARMLPLARALTRRNHQVHIIAPPVHNPQDAGQYEIYDGVTVVHTHMPTLSGGAGAAQQVLALLRGGLAHQPDVLHLFKPKGYSGLAALLARVLCPDVPLVVDTDDWEGWGGWNNLLPYPYAAKLLFAWQERDLPSRAQAVTVASRTLQTQVWGAGVAPERVFYLPNGIAPEATPVASVVRPKAAQANTVLLYTRFWECDVRDIVAALVAMVQQRPAVRLLVVGKGERGEEHTLLRLAQRAGVAPSLDYRGWAEPTAIPAFFAEADVAMVPIDDTLVNRARCSAKLLEMMQAGLPVVAARVGQMGEYIQHGANGLLVPPGNPAALAQGVLRLLDDAALRQRLGVAGRQSLAAFSWDILAPIAERAYKVCVPVADGL
jgi:glycosyltransferase involved in cell wall biosynthesis